MSVFGFPYIILTPSTVILRGCDFFVFLQKTMLKTNHLRAKKTRKVQKVTSPESSEGPAVLRNGKAGSSRCSE